MASATCGGFTGSSSGITASAATVADDAVQPQGACAVVAGLSVSVLTRRREQRRCTAFGQTLVLDHAAGSVPRERLSALRDSFAGRYCGKEETAAMKAFTAADGVGFDMSSSTAFAASVRERVLDSRDVLLRLFGSPWWMHHTDACRASRSTSRWM